MFTIFSNNLVLTSNFGPHGVSDSNPPSATGSKLRTCHFHAQAQVTEDDGQTRPCSCATRKRHHMFQAECPHRQSGGWVMLLSGGVVGLETGGPLRGSEGVQRNNAAELYARERAPKLCN